MHDTAVRNVVPVILPSLSGSWLHIEAEEDTFFSNSGSCIFKVKISIYRREEIGSRKTRKFLVSADELSFPHKPNEIRINQMLYRSSLQRTNMISLTAAEAVQWLTGDVTMRRRNRGRLLQELYDAIEPKLKRTNTW
jgi:hypothetical protein